MSRIRNNKNYRQEDNFKSPRRLARVRDMDFDDLYYDAYPESYKDTLRGKKPNRRMNGRPMGVCGSCSGRGR